MDLQDLSKDRFLQKNPDQTDQTKDAVYTAANPEPQAGNDSLSKMGIARTSTGDAGAPNVLTGTVIISCFIQTSALPSRVEMQGNDITLFDDTTSVGGHVEGDTSRIVFTHASGKQGELIIQGFILEKRASTHDTYDNVLSLYALPPKDQRMNYIFLGFNGNGTEFNTNAIQMVVNHDDGPVTFDGGNGLWAIGGTQNREVVAAPAFGLFWNGLLGVSGDGYCVLIRGTGTGTVVLGSDLLPITSGIDLGSSSDRLGTVYADVIDAGSIVGAGSAAVSPTLTAIPAMGATSATLSTAWTGSTCSRIAMFGNGDIRLANFLNGSTALSWAGGLSSGAGSNEIFTYN